MSAQSLDAQIRALVGGDDGSGAAGDQLSLEIFDDQPSPVALQLEARGVERRGPGRPAGSKNRQTLDLIKLIRATKRPTLLAIKEWVDLPLSDFMRATGIDKPAEALNLWFRMAELCAAYEEGRPTQRLDVNATARALPVVLFGSEPVRPDLVHGNAPIEGECHEVTDFTITDEGSSGNDKA